MTYDRWPLPLIVSMASMAEADQTGDVADGGKRGRTRKHLPLSISEMPSPIGLPIYNCIKNNVPVPHELYQGLKAPSITGEKEGEARPIARPMNVPLEPIHIRDLPGPI